MEINFLHTCIMISIFGAGLGYLIYASCECIKLIKEIKVSKKIIEDRMVKIERLQYKLSACEEIMKTVKMHGDKNR